jgi:5'-nucleotidase
MTVVVTNDDGVDSPGIHVLAGLLRSLGHEPVVVAPARDMSGASAAIGKIELDAPTGVRPVTLPAPAEDVPAYAVDGPPGLAALLAARRGIDGVEPSLVVSGINAGTNTGQAILHSGTVGAALTGASFGLSGIAVSLAVTDPMPWGTVRPWLAEALDLVRSAPAATVLNVNVPARLADGANGSLRWATLDRFGSFRVSVAERRESLVQLEYRSTEAELDPDSDTALVAAGIATVTAIEAIRAVPPDEIAFAEPRPSPEARLASGPRGEAQAEPAAD